MMFIVIIFQIIAAVMIASDASKRNMSSLFWFLFVLLLPLLSILLYLVTRNPISNEPTDEEKENLDKNKFLLDDLTFEETKKLVLKCYPNLTIIAFDKELSWMVKPNDDDTGYVFVEQLDNKIKLEFFNIDTSIFNEMKPKKENKKEQQDDTNAVIQIEKLFNLKEKGALTEEEFNEQKQKILSA